MSFLSFKKNTEQGRELYSDLSFLFSQVFGLGLVEIDPKYHSYILISKFPPLEAEIANE